MTLWVHQKSGSWQIADLSHRLAFPQTVPKTKNHIGDFRTVLIPDTPDQAEKLLLRTWTRKFRKAKRRSARLRRAMISKPNKIEWSKRGVNHLAGFVPFDLAVPE